MFLLTQLTSTDSHLVRDHDSHHLLLWEGRSVLHILPSHVRILLNHVRILPCHDRTLLEEGQSHLGEDRSQHEVEEEVEVEDHQEGETARGEEEEVQLVA